MTRDWRKGDAEGLANHIRSVDFAALFQDKNVDECWDNLKSTIDSALDRYIPLCFRRKSDQPLWLNQKVKNLLNRKRRHWRRYRSNRSEANFEQFKKTEKECKKCIQSAKGSLKER